MITTARRKRAEVAGTGLHVWGMWTVHRIDRDDGVGDSVCVRALHGLCWVLLAALAVYLL